jgi:hypothetical protein
VPTVRELKAALARTSPDERTPTRDVLAEYHRRGHAPLLAQKAEQESAPLITRDALLALLDEARASKRRADVTLGVAVLTLIASVASVVIAALALNAA